VENGQRGATATVPRTGIRRIACPPRKQTPFRAVSVTIRPEKNSKAEKRRREERRLVGDLSEIASGCEQRPLDPMSDEPISR
jgi:hypothetical protein